MRALVKLAAAPGQVEVRERPAPVPGPSEVVVRVRLAGLCHTDLSMAEWNQAARHAYQPAFPLILGHEFAGTVDALGPGTAGPEPGTPVAGSAHLTCGRCAMCRAGRSMLCPGLRVLGLDVDGVLATHVRLPVRNVVRLPAGLPWEVAGLAEPFAVASHAVAAGGRAAGQRVAIIGPGAVGLCALAVALTQASEVVVFGLASDRVQLGSPGGWARPRRRTSRPPARIKRAATISSSRPRASRPPSPAPSGCAGPGAGWCAWDCRPSRYRSIPPRWPGRKSG